MLTEPQPHASRRAARVRLWVRRAALMLALAGVACGAAGAWWWWSGNLLAMRLEALPAVVSSEVASWDLADFDPDGLMVVSFTYDGVPTRADMLAALEVIESFPTWRDIEVTATFEHGSRSAHVTLGNFTIPGYDASAAVVAATDARLADAVGTLTIEPDHPACQGPVASFDGSGESFVRDAVVVREVLADAFGRDICSLGVGSREDGSWTQWVSVPAGAVGDELIAVGWRVHNALDVPKDGGLYVVVSGSEGIRVEVRGTYDVWAMTAAADLAAGGVPVDVTFRAP